MTLTTTTLTRYYKRATQAIRRRFRLAVITSIIALAALLLTYERPIKQQRIEMHFLVSQEPLDSTLEIEEERYNLWVASEYVVWGLADWANGTNFAEEVSRQMIALDYDSEDFSTQEIDKNMYSSAARSRLLIGVLADDEKSVRDMARIASDIIVNRPGEGIPQFERARAFPFLLDNIEDENLVVEVDPNITEQIGLPARLLLGLLSGMLLALLLDYLDPTIRYPDRMKTLDIPILAEIPEAVL